MSETTKALLKFELDTLALRYRLRAAVLCVHDNDHESYSVSSEPRDGSDCATLKCDEVLEKQRSL